MREIPSGDLSWVESGDPQPWEVLAAWEEHPAGRPGNAEPPAAVLIGLTGTWGRTVTRYDPRKGPCPGCADQRPRPGAVCVVCHQTRSSPVQWPMQTPLRGAVRTRRLRGGISRVV
jgi:hypothetical protein